MINMEYLAKSCVILLFIIFEIFKVQSSSLMIVRNNGPAILDANITFVATLFDFDPQHTLTYIFDDGVQKTESQTKSSNITITRHFSHDLYGDGTYFMNVTVKTEEYYIIDHTIAQNSSKFSLKRELIGRINVYYGNETATVDVDEVPIGENISLVVDLVDNSNYLQNAVIEYGWSIDYERQYSLGNSLVYNFSSVGYKNIRAIVTATFPNNDFKVGTFQRNVNAKVPVNHINISGNPFLYHGDKLNLNIYCNGTPPFIYCYKIMKSNSSYENFTCSQFSTFSTCHMEIIKYIQDDGKYNVGIYISNNVKEIKRIIEVMVYSVPVQPNLSTVVIPIVCSVLTLIILAGGISFCIQQRNQLAVEVANFDFQDESDSFTERTFFENILDNFTCRNCGHAPQSSPETESDPLI